MGKVLKVKNWLGLAILSMGVGVVQLSAVSKAKEHDASSQGMNTEASQRVTGFLVILAAAALSSLAGVSPVDMCVCAYFLTFF